MKYGLAYCRMPKRRSKRYLAQRGVRAASEIKIGRNRGKWNIILLDGTKQMVEYKDIIRLPEGSVENE